MVKGKIALTKTKPDTTNVHYSTFFLFLQCRFLFEISAKNFYFANFDPDFVRDFCGE